MKDWSVSKYIVSNDGERERDMIIYIYKIRIGIVQNPWLVFEYNPRTKLRAIPSNNTYINTKVQRMRETSFFNIAPRLFNTLPIFLRELEVSSNSEKVSIETFERKLDQHLANIPDLPGNILNTLLSEYTWVYFYQGRFWSVLYMPYLP